MRPSALIALICLSASLGAGCNSPIVAKVVPSLSTAPRSYFVRVANGLTSPTMSEAMRISPRTFSAFQVAEVCRTAARVDRLEAPTRAVSLRVGERLTLSTLRIVAVSDGNLAVRDVPVVIEAEELNPPVIQLSSDDADIDQGRLLTVGSGTFRVRVRTLCAATNAEMMIVGTVTP